MKEIKLIKLFFLTVFVLFFMVFMVFYIIDPLKIYHKPLFYSKYLHSNMRLQSLGIINNFSYDSLILGTSMLENTSSNKASKVLGGDFVNISMSGSDFYERSIILKYILNKKEVKKVLYSLDYKGLIFSNKGHDKYGLETFDYLYDENRLNDFKVYLNNKDFKCIFFNFEYDKCFGRKVDLDRPNSWFQYKSNASRFGGLDSWVKAKDNPQIKANFKTIFDYTNKIKNGEVLIEDNFIEKTEESIKYLNETLIYFAKKNPSVEFILIIPPYSRVQNAIDAQYKKTVFLRLKENIKYLVFKSNEYKNISIYAWGNKDFPDDISNYKDLGHYSPDINSNMLYWIKNKEGLLTINNVNEYLKDFERKSLAFDMNDFSNKIKLKLEIHKYN
ncbi:hypothetical protein [Marinomonas sp. PE14-40]|uniref:hypothetical protein n=1 Tax=Marinomonas sp. PE14-40 TaxID=3060621 RepID=UPI003F66ACF7